jgi:hypothetical protein
MPAAERTSRGTLGPNTEIEARSRPAVLGVAERMAITDNRAALYVVGLIEYTDAFKRPQWATFRLEFGKRHAEAGDGRMTACFEGNDAS